MHPWHQLAPAEVVQKLGTDATGGLSETEANRRLGELGPNELIERGLKSPWLILWEQLTATMVIVLIVAAAISAAMGDYNDAAAIMAIVVLNALLGFTQEYRAEKAMAALRKLAVPTVKVRRAGHIKEISARELVPGDLVLLEAGNFVPADGRLLESVNLRIQEAALSGESEPVEKDAGVLAEADLPLGDRRNMAYLGTVVTYGRGLAVVTETGMKTELGRIAAMIQAVEPEPTPLQKRMEQLGRGIAVAALVIVAVVFVLGLLRGEEIKLMFLTAISMAVAAVPEGLPAVMTVALALGAQRMLKRHVLIRKLPAVETLGSVTVICADKTGTLTESRMTVTVLDVAGHRVDLTESLRHAEAVLAPDEEQFSMLSDQPALSLLLAGSALCNDAVLQPSGHETEDFRAVGDPTEGALVVAAARFDLWKSELEQVFPRVMEVPFDSERKRMTTVHRVLPSQLATALEMMQRWNLGGWPYVAFTKGAVDSLAMICQSVWVNGQAESLDEEWRRRISQAQNELSQNGMRVLGLALRTLDSLPPEGRWDLLEKDLSFVGMVGMIDPPRPEVKEAVQTCKSAGIRPVMITGDHPLTAHHIARQLGITSDGHILTGKDLAEMSVEQLEVVVEEVPVYARVSPEHKLKIVQALKARGHIVAMTGDGVNDAPALKKADIGVAMGITGTDVAKEAADVVLLDDNFASIVAAVKEGRVIYDNIRKFIKYLAATNSAELWVMLLAPFVGMPLPLLPLQILWINLITDGLPALALSVEPAEQDTMRRPPYRPTENIFSRGLGWYIVWGGILMGLISLGAGYVYWHAGHPHWQMIVFNTLCLSQLANVLAIRSERESLFRLGMLTNKLLLGAVSVGVGLQLAVIYVPFLQAVFKTTALSGEDLLISLALSTVVFWVVELEKWVVRRK